jgi:hypothetical protein|tara:strand:+ start:1246 stop:1884 length:639 start_codon:yes stop_codon:yes gene_type:complete
MGLPLAYGLYLVAAATAKAGAQYAIRKLGGKAAGNLISRHTTRELATKAKRGIEKKLEPKNVPQHRIQYSARGEKGKTPAVSLGKGLGHVPLSGFQKGVQNDLLRAQAAGIGKGQLRSIIKHAIPAVLTTAGIGVGTYKFSQNENEKLRAELKKAIHRADAPTKKEYMKAVKPKTPPETAKADKAFEDFMAGKKRSLNFKHGGMVRKTKRKK